MTFNVTSDTQTKQQQDHYNGIIQMPQFLRVRIFTLSCGEAYQGMIGGSLESLNDIREFPLDDMIARMPCKRVNTVEDIANFGGFLSIGFI